MRHMAVFSGAVQQEPLSTSLIESQQERGLLVGAFFQAVGCRSRLTATLRWVLDSRCSSLQHYGEYLVLLLETDGHSPAGYDSSV